MKHKIERETGIPAYMQIYIGIRGDIVNGVYAHSQRLPSKRVLAEATGTSVVTVQHAYDILCDEGYVQARERSGYFVTYVSDDSFGSAELSIPTKEQSKGERRALDYTADTSLTTSEYFPFSVFSKTMRRVLSKYGESLYIKSPNHGCAELRQALASYLARSRGIEVTPEQVIIGSGSEYMYSLIIQLLGREHIYAAENPSYEKIQKVYSAAGVSFELLKLGADGILSSELLKTKATVLHVTPFNSYPSGITASASKRHEYIRWAKQSGGIIIEDDFDSEFSVSAKTADTLFSLEPCRTVIYLNTFSKTVAPSIRAGYMVLPRELLPQFDERVGFYSCTVPLPEQYMLAELLNSGSFERHINKIRRERRKNASLSP